MIQLVTDGLPHPPSMEAEALRRELANGELEREASTSFTDLEAGTYNVLIYDVGVDGTFDLDKSLYNEQFEIKNLLPIEPVPTSTSVSPGMTSICHVIHHFHFLYHVHGRYGSYSAYSATSFWNLTCTYLFLSSSKWHCSHTFISG